MISIEEVIVAFLQWRGMFRRDKVTFEFIKKPTIILRRTALPFYADNIQFKSVKLEKVNMHWNEQCNELTKFVVTWQTHFTNALCLLSLYITSLSWLSTFKWVNVGYSFFSLFPLKLVKCYHLLQSWKGQNSARTT